MTTPFAWLVVVGVSGLLTVVAASCAYTLGKLAGWREAAAMLEDEIARRGLRTETHEET